jgi:hypothetical protein
VVGTTTTVVLGVVVVVVVESATGGALAATQRPSVPQVPTTASPLVVHVPTVVRSSVALVATASVQVAPACWQQTGVAESGMSATQPDVVQKPGWTSSPPLKKQFSIGPPNWKHPAAVTQHAPPTIWQGGAELGRALADLAVVEPAVAARERGGHAERAAIDGRFQLVRAAAAGAERVGTRDPSHEAALDPGEAAGAWRHATSQPVAVARKPAAELPADRAELGGPAARMTGREERHADGVSNLVGRAGAGTA